MSGHPVLPAEKITLPLLPLRDVVVFPHMVIPLFVGRPKSIKALEVAMEAGRQIMLVAQKAAGKDEPKPDDMFEVGCVSSILQMLKLPDGTVKVLVEGVQRATTHSVTDNGEYFVSEVTPVPPEAEAKSEVEALRRAVTQQFDQYVKLNKKIPPEILTSIAGIDDAGRLADTIAAHLPLKLENKQSVLDLVEVDKRLEKLLEQLEHEVDILQVEKRIRGRVKRQMEKSQREYYLNEQVKAIQKELGDGEEGADMEELEKKIIAAKMPKEAKKKADAEFKKLKLMSPMSAEATVVRNYIDTLVNLPWAKKTKIKQDLAFAEQVLDEDHYGLDKVKDRILEYLAVQQRVDKMKSPILCLVGPPGVGKTSLGQSVARATGRKFVRMALGGVRDEAEIRGHRRTYIGSMPGKVLQSPDQDRHPEPAVPARRDRQARHGLPRRSVVGAARGARPGAEPHLQRPLRRGRLRPVGHDVHRDLELDEHPAGAARPDGGDPPRRATPRTRRSTSRCATCCPSSRRTTASRPRRWKSPSRRCAASSATTRARPACARSSARSPRSAARSSRRSSSSRSPRRSSSPRTTSTTTWACASTTTARPRRRTRSARSSASPGPRSAATC